MAVNPSHYVIVGGSAAGMAAAGAIRELDRQAKLTVFSEEAEQPYFRPLLPFLISGQKQAADMTLLGQGPYRHSNYHHPAALPDCIYRPCQQNNYPGGRSSRQLRQTVNCHW